MTAEGFSQRLEVVRKSGRGFISRCPAHKDRTPSLSVRDGERGVLVKCWAGCRLQDITAAVGLTVRDLFPDAPTPHNQRSIPKQKEFGFVALAYRFELAALDRRLRAERVLKAATNFKNVELSEQQRDRLMNAVACAYDDNERAEFLEAVADDFRLKAFHGRTKHHAAKC